MSHPENCKATALLLRVKAAALRKGNEGEHLHADNLEQEAQEIERHLGRGDRGEA